MGTPWGQTWANFKQELNEHFYDYQKDIWENEENNAFDKFFLTFEMPFTVLRKVSDFDRPNERTLNMQDLFCYFYGQEIIVMLRLNDWLTSFSPYS